jgi:hypothetical protein
MKSVDIGDLAGRRPSFGITILVTQKVPESEIGYRTIRRQTYDLILL